MYKTKNARFRENLMKCYTQKQLFLGALNKRYPERFNKIPWKTFEMASF